MDMKEIKGCQLVKRVLLWIGGEFVIAFGIAMTKKAELGVTPISSVANIMSIRFTVLTIGSWLILWNCFLVIGQIIILKKRFQSIQFLQLVLTILIGKFTDLGLYVLKNTSVNSYLEKILFVIVGTFVLAFGIVCMLKADIVMSPGEGFPKAIAETFNKDFGVIKVICDVLWVVLSALLSCIFFRGKIVEMREGTVLSAIACGFFVNFFKNVFKRLKIEI